MIKVFFMSLGCDKNLVDSEKMITLLFENGYEVVDNENVADVAVINTCSFIEDAKTESIENILYLAELKKEGSLKALIVTGCLSQRYQSQLRDEIPEVDAFVGTFAIADIVDAINNSLKGSVKDYITDICAPLDNISRRYVSTSGHFAYLKISDGCDKHCTYCAIPEFKGRYRSYPIDELVDEARYLCENIGVKELILVGQETTLYGTDLYDKKMLVTLIRRLSEIQSLVWIRLLYCYPEEIDEELVEEMSTNPKVCHYIDMPIQHASNDILFKMGRRVSKEDIIDKVNMLRSAMPDIAIRTSLITGFPGETDKEHKELLAFIKKIKFDRLGVFMYSKEEGTPAYKFKNHVLKKIKKQRRDEIMTLQQQLAFKKASKLKGRKLLVMIEGKLPEENVYIGRTYMDAPNVDGMIFVTSDRELMTGDMAFCKVTGSNEYDLIGVILE